MIELGTLTLYIGHGGFFFKVMMVSILFLLKSKRRSRFFLRLLPISAVTYAGCLFVPDVAIGGIFDPFYILFALFVGGVVVFSFDISPAQTLAYVGAGVALQNMIYNFCRIILNYVLGETGFSLSRYAIGAAAFAVVVAFFYFAFIRRINESKPVIGKTKLIIIGVGDLVVAMFLSSIIDVYMTDIISSTIALVLIIAVDFLLLCVEFSIFEVSRVKRENDTLNLLVNVGKEQAMLSQENIDIINRKCHDLKHQISALKNMTGGKPQQEYIEDLEKSIMIYGSIAKTGNAPLDILITEKSLYCESHDIRFTYMVQGEKLDFMNYADIYSLFGNALDNAIEASVNIREHGKRIINLNVAAKGSLLSINLENCLEVLPSFEDGLPVTTKENKAYHGYGVKSIKYIVEKYDGVLKIKTKSNMFLLNIMIPIAKKATA